MRFCLIFLLAALPSSFALQDYRPRIAVIPVRNTTGESRYDAACETVSETVALGLKLVGKYLVTEVDDDPSLSDVDSSSLEAIARRAEVSHLDSVLFGEATRVGDGPLTISISVFDRGEGKVKSSTSAEASSMLDVFDAADALTAELLKQFGETHVGFGSIRIEEPAERGKYSIFLDGNRIRNPKTDLRKVLNGKYNLTVHQERLLGDAVIFERTLEVFEDTPATVSFAIPAATAPEISYLEARQKKVEAAGADPNNYDGMLRELAAFQEIARKADYDPTLRAMQEKTLAEAGKKATEMLGKALGEADALFYAKKPDFAAAGERYQNLSGMVNDVFEYRVVEQGDEAAETNPREVRLAPEGSLYILEADVTPTLRLSRDGKTLEKTLPLEEAGALIGHVSIDSAANVYYVAPASGSILVFDKNLEKLKNIPFPEQMTENQQISAVAVSDEGHLYVGIGDQIMVMEPEGGREREIEETISSGLKKGGVSRINDLFFDSDGLLDVFCGWEKKLLRFDSLGATQSEVAFPLCETESSVAVDGLGYIYVTLPSEHRVVKYSPRGETVASFGKYGVNLGEFSQPHGIAATADGSLVVADTFNNRVQVLTLTAPPVLLPEVSRFGMRFSARGETARKAQQRIDLLKENANWESVFSSFAVSAGFAAAWVAGHIMAAPLEIQASQADANAAVETDPVKKTDYEKEANDKWVAFNMMTLGTALSGSVGAGYLTWGILSAIDKASAERRAISQIQGLSMDEEYEFDRAAYRSLKSSESIGFWTGVIPPIIPLLAGIGAAVSLPVDINVFTITMAAGIGIPPIWSHLYSGEFHLGLLVSGLVADALCAGGMLLMTGIDFTVPSSADLGSPIAVLNDAWKTLPGWIGPYMIAAGIGVRLAAGVYDMQNGWIAAKDNNLYRALKRKKPEVSMQILPGRRWGETGIALCLRY